MGRKVNINDTAELLRLMIQSVREIERGEKIIINARVDFCISFYRIMGHIMKIIY